MKAFRLITFCLCALILIAESAAAQSEGMNKEISDLTSKLAAVIKEQGKKKVTVLDFTDLNGGSTELGRYIAEEITLNLVINKREFSILDRANLKSVLAEHKLTATGLVDPDNAKKLGMFAGVDALILGNIVTLDNKLQLTAKIITTDTAEIVGATRHMLTVTPMVQELQAKRSHHTPGGESLKEDAPQVIKTFGDLQVELHGLRILDGKKYLATMTLTNCSTKKPIFVAVRVHPNGTTRSIVHDSEDSEFEGDREVLGLADAALSYDGSFYGGTELRPGDMIHVSMKFFSRQRAKPQQGTCNLRFELLSTTEFSNSIGTRAVVHTISTKLRAQ